MKKILSYLLVLALILGLFSTGFHVGEAKAAETTYTFGDYEYTLDEDGAASITKYSGSSASVVIPSELEGHTVKCIGNGVFKGCKQLKSIKIPETVTKIGSYAFENIGLTSLELPQKLEEIGNKILLGATGVKEIKIPKSVKSAGSYAITHGGSFSGSSLETVEFEEGITFLPEYILDGCGSLTNVKIPDTVTGIGTGAFRNCSKLNAIEIPETVTEIGSYAFEGCKQLTSIKIPETVTKIGSYAFENIGLTSLELPQKLEEIGNKILLGATGVKEIKIPKSVKSAGSYAITHGGSFSGSSLETVEFEEGITFLPEYILDGCGSLTNVKIPDTVTGIGTGAFRNCSKLNAIEIPETVTEIGSYAFENIGLTSLELPQKLEEIGNKILLGATGVKEIKIPKSVKSAGSYAITHGGSFSGSSLETVEFEEGMTFLPEYILDGCGSLTNVKIPDTVTGIGTGAFRNCKKLTALKIPRTVTEIGSYAFENTNFTSFDLPLGLKKLGKAAFLNVPITQITVPASLESADEPFSGSGLTDAYFENGTTKVINSLFTNCSKLKNVNIPDEVASIGRSAFSGCSSLTTLTLPISVTTIGDYAFENCTGLKELYVRHKIKEIGNRSFNNCPSLYVKGTLYSDTMMTMINHDVNMNFTDTVYKDESGKILDHFNSVYELNTTSSSGYTTLNLEYSLKTKAVSKATDLKLIIKLPSTSIVKDVKLDGMSLKEGYATDENLLTIPVTAKSGKCQIFTTPNENGRMVSYAALSYKRDGKTGTDIIGAISEDCSCLTLQVPDTVGYEENKDSASLEIRGFGQKEKDVEVYLDGKLVDETVVSKGGMYSSKLALPDPDDYKSYKIRVKSVDKNGNDVEIIRSVKTVNGEPELESAELYIEAHDYKNGYQEFDLMESDSLVKYITFQPGKAYRFTIKYINREKISHVYVVSKRGGVSRKLEAVYDVGKDAYITKGFFNNDSRYVPGNLSIEYTTEPEKPVINSDGTVSELSNREKNSVPDKWKNASVKENTSTKSDYEADITLSSGEVVTYTYDAMSFTEYAEELEQKRDEGASEEAQADSWQQRGRSRSGSDVVGDIIDVLKLFDNDEIKDITEVYDFLEKDGFIKYVTGEEDLAEDVSLMKTDFENGQMVYYLINPDASENTIQKYILKKGNDAIQSTIFEALGIDGTAAGLVIDTASNMAELYGTTINVLLMKQDILLDTSLTESQREAKLKEVQKVADIACAKTVFTLMSDVLGVAAATTSVTGVGIALGAAALVIDKVIIPMIERGDFDDFISGNISLDDLIIRWIIDPSGYVYEGVTSNRLSGATTTIYYKETLESNEVIKWNASEYDQLNPLKTDADGGYSWDVPEGYWQVKVELEGYETAYSEWLEVPPPQTNVNIKMERKENPVVDSFEPFETFAVLTFSQYMSPDTVKYVQLKDGNGDDLAYSLSYSGDETDADGNVYAKKYILKYEKVMENTDKIQLLVGEEVKSSSGNSAKEEVKTAGIANDITITGDDYVKISIEDTYEYEFQINGYAKEKTNIQIDHPSIIECTETVGVSEEGQGKVLLKPLAYGSATMTIFIEGKSVTKKIDLSVGSETVSGKKESTDINLPPVIDQPTPTPTTSPTPLPTQTPIPTEEPESPATSTPVPVPTGTPNPPQSQTQQKDESKGAQNQIQSPADSNKESDITVKVKSLKLKAKKKSFTAKWKKVSGAKGYQIQYALSKKKLSKGKRKNVKKTSVTVKKLKKKKTYYVRVRAYRVVNNRNVYGKWSAVKKVKIKK